MGMIGAGHLQAWLGNGLQELQSAVALGNEQVQPGHNPGLVGSVMPQEVTQARQEAEAPAPVVEAGQIQKSEPEPELEM